MKEWIIRYLIVIGISATGTYLASFILKYISRAINCMDRPDDKYKLHVQATPRLGGIAIYAGFIISIGYFLFYTASPGHDDSVYILAISSLMTLLVGLWDDFRKIHSDGLSALIKLAILFVLTFILSLNGIIINLPFPREINIALTLLWLVGCTSAFNAMDNMDGLASGISLIAAMAYAAVAIQTYQFVWGIIAAALIGGNLGFLFHNFHPISKKPASIFMGDGGSFFLGFTLAVMSVMGGWSSNPVKASIIPIFILGVPLVDLVYVIFRRQKLGITKSLKDIIVYSGTDHFSHRINQAGFSRHKSVLLIYLISFSVSLGAVILRNTAKYEAILLLAQFCLTFLIIFIFIEVHLSQDKQKS
ncbi:MAG: MraY family glycosyltransferase [Candidatus Brocadiia bacterium]